MNRKELEKALGELLPSGADFHLTTNRFGELVFHTDTYWDDVAGVLKPMRAKFPDDM